MQPGPGLCKKFVHKWAGPFIIRSIQYPNVILYDPASECVVYPWVHVNRIKKGYSREDLALSQGETEMTETETTPVVEPSHSYNLRSRTPVVVNPQAMECMLISGDARWQ